MHTFNCRVYYEDTDAAGIVYYANYLKFIERARTETLRKFGISQSVVKEKYGIIFVVKTIFADYCKPAKLDDFMEIRTVFLRFGTVSLELKQEIFVKENIIFKAQIKLGVLDSNGNPKRLPMSIKEKLIDLGNKGIQILN